jgi:hypothetical protein
VTLTTARYTPGRVLTVTLGLLLAGIGCGAVAGAVALAIVSLIRQEYRPFSDPILFAVAATLGAMVGALCIPVAWWLLLQRVPLRRALIGLTMGAIAGGVAGWFVVSSSRRDDILIVAALGIFVAALVLRFFHGRTSKFEV